MNQKQLDIGKRIRALRHSQSLTQADVCGESITRNMLSLIENGNASPSLPTLIYLSQRLGVPVGYFFSTSDEEIAGYAKMSRIHDIRQLFCDSEFSACIDLCRTLPHPDDEIRRILAECYMAQANIACSQKMLATAELHLNNAQRILNTRPLGSEALASTVDFFLHLIHGVTGTRISRDLWDADRYPCSRIPAEFFVYLRALDLISGGNISQTDALTESGLIRSSLYLDFLSAKSLMVHGRHKDALPILQKIYASQHVGFFTAFRTLSALEDCASTLGDFKNAYHYSTEKIRMLEMFAK